MATRLSVRESLPTALFRADDPIALGAVNALLERDFRVPERIFVVARLRPVPRALCLPFHF